MVKKVDQVAEQEIITVQRIEMRSMRFNLVGTTPLMPHAMSAHARGQILFPPPKKNAAERATTMKHEPYKEFREAAYKFTDQEANGTRLYMPAGSIHSAIRDVAIDMKGARKAQVGRLTSVPGLKLALYGVPELVQCVVRSSDMKRTPDIRTLPILRQWALPNVEIRFVEALIKEASIANLLANAGDIIGIGDGRKQKGYFDYGSWRLAHDDDEEMEEILSKGGIQVQDAALDNPKFYDIETEQLMTWFEDEKKRRTAGPPTSARVSSNGRRKPPVQPAVVITTDVPPSEHGYKEAE